MWSLSGLACGVLACISAAGAEFNFRYHQVASALPIDGRGTGDYGLTALVDLDKDGDLDFVLGGRFIKPSRLYWFEFQGPDKWVQHLVGTNYESDVGLAALDVDRDGWPDLVCSGVWYGTPADRVTVCSNASASRRTQPGLTTSS